MCLFSASTSTICLFERPSAFSVATIQNSRINDQLTIHPINGGVRLHTSFVNAVHLFTNKIGACHNLFLDAPFLLFGLATFIAIVFFRWYGFRRLFVGLSVY